MFLECKDTKKEMETIHFGKKNRLLIPFVTIKPKEWNGV